MAIVRAFDVPVISIRDMTRDQRIELAEQRRIARQHAEKQRFELRALGVDPRAVPPSRNFAEDDQRPAVGVPKCVHAEREISLQRAARRIERVLRRQKPTAGEGGHVRGIRRGVWCVELGVRYYSLCQAARFINRTASNIGQSIRSKGHVKCGGYTWEIFDPQRHKLKTVAA